MWIFIIVLLSAGFGYYFYQRRGFHHNWQIDYHFNPRSVLSPVSEFAPNLKDRPIPIPLSSPMTSNYESFVPVEKSNYTEVVVNNALPATSPHPYQTATLENLCDDYEDVLIGDAANINTSKRYDEEKEKLIV